MGNWKIVNGQFHSPRMKLCNLESFFFVKNAFIMKNLTDFCKTVETSVDPCLRVLCRVQKNFS